MDYATYSNLVRGGDIIMVCDGGICNCLNKPSKEDWNGKVVLIDLDTGDAMENELTKIKFVKNEKFYQGEYECIFSVWG